MLIRVVPAQNLPATLTDKVLERTSPFGFHIYKRGPGGVNRLTFTSLRAAADGLVHASADPKIEEMILTVETLSTLTARVWPLVEWDSYVSGPVVQVHPEAPTELREWIAPLLVNEVPY